MKPETDKMACSRRIRLGAYTVTVKRRDESHDRIFGR